MIRMQTNLSEATGHNDHRACILGWGWDANQSANLAGMLGASCSVHFAHSITTLPVCQLGIIVDTQGIHDIDASH